MSEEINYSSVLYLSIWVFVTVYVYTKTIWVHIRSLSSNKWLRDHVGEHLNIIFGMMVTQVLIFLHMIFVDNALYAGIQILHIAIGVMTISNVYFARHITDEITC